jgi:hypothetical protein
VQPGDPGVQLHVVDEEFVQSLVGCAALFEVTRDAAKQRLLDRAEASFGLLRT